LKWRRITTLREVESFLPLTPEERRAFESVTRLYPFSSTEYYLRLAGRSPAVRRMLMPSLEEIDESLQGQAEEDPLREEEHTVLPYLIHKYPDRALIVTTNVCPALCRFCMRKRNWKRRPFTIGRKELSAILDYIAGNREIRDVIVSGGEPLILPVHTLRELILKLEEIEHVEVVRIGTRLPAVLPQALKGELLKLLRQSKKVWVNTHFNHPDEITESAKSAVRRILKAGVPVNNQSVLLKGVNDSPTVLERLLRELRKARIRAYYLFQCDPVKGVLHFATPAGEGLKIVREVVSRLSPLFLPYYAVDGAKGKSLLHPTHL